MNRIREANKNTPEYWEVVYQRELGRGKIRRNREMWKVVLEHMVDPLLDVGCGSGELVGFVRSKKRKAYGIDISKTAVRWAVQRYGEHFKVADIRKGIKARNGAFGSIAALEVLEHVDDPKALVKELSRVTKHVLIVSVPNERRVVSPEHVWEFDKADLIALLGDKVQILEVNGGKRLIGVLHKER